MKKAIVSKEMFDALRKTIRRWKIIVKDTSYYERSTCDLCLHVGTVHNTNLWDCSSCPIGQKTKGLLSTGCRTTPWENFMELRTRENALKELVFLEELYIELLEGEVGVVPGYPEKPAKPKEEWVDITEEIEWKLRDDFVFTMCHEGRMFGHMHDWCEFYIVFKSEYKAEPVGSASGLRFKISKKVTK